MSDEVVFRKHPMPSRLSAQTSIMHKENEIGAFSIAPLEHLELGLGRRRICDITVELKFDGHAASLEGMSGLWRKQKTRNLTYPI